MVVFFSLTPRRIALSISSPCGASIRAVSAVSGSGWPVGSGMTGPSCSSSSSSFSDRPGLCSSAITPGVPGTGGFTEACPLHKDAGMSPPSTAPSVMDGESGLCSGDSSLVLLGRPPGMSGTVGVLTGITGVFIGMGPPPMVPRLTDGLVDGVLRMVATPGVTITGAKLAGNPAVDAGRLD